MIRIGLEQVDKQKVINNYLSENEIKKVYCFYFKKFKYNYDVNCEIEYIEYSDMEMYKYFYRLLEEIDNNSLIIVDECMRTQNRSELKYNCCHHYLNQTTHKIIFEYLPMIENIEDLMILLDFENKTKYKGKKFDFKYLNDEDIKMKRINYKLNRLDIGHSDDELEKYDLKKEALFDGLGNKDPDTIPRTLQLLAGDFKKKNINDDYLYVARNKRFKKKNIVTYDEVKENTDYIVLDFHYRRLNMNDYLKRTKATKIDFINTNLSVDVLFISKFEEWINNLEEIYAKASLY